MPLSPTDPKPLGHFELSDRYNNTMTLTVADENGKPRPFHDERLFVKIPVETTAQKQTSGSSSYADFDYPYSPIVEDDVSGGRGGGDFERDSTKVFDFYRTNSARQNKAYAGPIENYLNNGIAQSMPGSVQWKKLIGDDQYVIQRIQVSYSFTVGLVWLLFRRIGTPGTLTVAIHNDSAGAIGSEITHITVSSTRLEDTLSEWLNEAISLSVTATNYYWIVVSSSGTDTENACWVMGCSPVASSTYHGTSIAGKVSATYGLYYRLTPAVTNKKCIMFEYMEQTHFIVSPEGSNPNVYIIGDRGAADSNAGQLTKLIDATKNWKTNEWAGQPVLITDGTGKLENQRWRTVVSNDAISLTVNEAWKITHDTTTTYSIFGTQFRSLGACGLTASVTDVVVSPTGVVYVCMGDSVTIRALRAYNNAGTWRDFDDAANCQRNETDAKSKAMFMVYKPQAQTLVIANNSDVNGDVSVNTNTNTGPSIPVWGTSLTWGATPVKVDSKYREINGLIVHPDNGGTEAVWVFKTDVPFIVPSTGNPYPLSIDEMRNVRSDKNGSRPMRHGVYLYFPLLQGIQRYYGGQFDSVGPNIGEGLPKNRQGRVVQMLGYPGKFYVAIDAGDSGYSSIMESSWHEKYRAPKGQRIQAMSFQVTPGSALDRLWVVQGNDLLWMPFPSESTNELEDASYEYTPEFSITLARMHAGMFDVQKIVKKIKLQTDRLEMNGETPVCWFELDYRLDNETTWNSVGEIFNTSPTQTVDFTSLYGISGRRLQFRLRGYTSDASKTPIFIAIIISAVVRVDIKNMYGPYTMLVKDDERVGLRENEVAYTADEKLAQLENWGDASNDSMILMRSVSNLCDNKMIFLNVGTRRQIAFAGAENNPYKGNAYLVSVTMQEA